MSHAQRNALNYTNGRIATFFFLLLIKPHGLDTRTKYRLSPSYDFNNPTALVSLAASKHWVQNCTANVKLPDPSKLENMLMTSMSDSVLVFILYW